MAPSFEVAISLEKVVDKHRHRQISPFPHDSYALLSQIIELMPEIVISADLADVEPGVGHATLAPRFEVAISLEKVEDKHRHRQISPFPHDSYA